MKHIELSEENIQKLRRLLKKDKRPLTGKDLERAQEVAEKYRSNKENPK